MKKNNKPSVRSGRKKSPSRKKNNRLLIVLGSLFVLVGLVLGINFFAPSFFTPVRVAFDRLFAKCAFWNLPDAIDDVPVKAVDLRNPYSVYGIDVSRYQGTINWDSIAIVYSSSSSLPKRKLKVSFAFLKATMGGGLGPSGSDPFYETNLDQAKAHGIMVGAYHVFKPEKDATLQAKAFLRKAQTSRLDLPPVLDIENNLIGKPRMKYLNSVLDWLRLVEAECGCRPIIYCSDHCRRDILNTPSFKNYKFWIARYRDDKPKSVADWVFWQFTEKGVVKGISDRGRNSDNNHLVDIDVFNGSAQEFDSWCSSCWLNRNLPKNTRNKVDKLIKSPSRPAPAVKDTACVQL